MLLSLSYSCESCVLWNRTCVTTVLLIFFLVVKFNFMFDFFFASSFSVLPFLYSWKLKILRLRTLDAKSFRNSYSPHPVELRRVCASNVVIKHSTMFVIPEIAYFLPTLEEKRKGFSLKFEFVIVRVTGCWCTRALYYLLHKLIKRFK